jgi:hypothetical protein
MATAPFAFHDVLWLERAGVLIAAEEGGRVWLFDPKGKTQALLDDAGTTAHRMVARERGNEILLGRMNRVVQRVVVA